MPRDLLAERQPIDLLAERAPIDLLAESQSDEQTVSDRTFGEAAKDVAVSFGAGANTVMGSLGTMYGLASGRKIQRPERSEPMGVSDSGFTDPVTGKFVDTAKPSGFIPQHGATVMDNPLTRQAESGREYYESKKSPKLQAESRALQERIQGADSELGKMGVAFWGTMTSPELLSAFVGEQMPMLATSMIGGRSSGLIARGMGAGEQVAGKAATAGAVGTGAALQGADAGSQAYEQLMAVPEELWQQNPEYAERVAAGVSPHDAKSQIATGLARNAAVQSAAVSGALNMMIPGARVLEQSLSGAKVAGSRIAAGARGFAGEAVQEAGEEGHGVVAANVATSKIGASGSLFEGTGEAAGQGAVGGIFGGAAGVTAPRARKQTPTPAADIDNITRARSVDEAINAAADALDNADIRAESDLDAQLAALETELAPPPTTAAPVFGEDATYNSVEAPPQAASAPAPETDVTGTIAGERRPFLTPDVYLSEKFNEKAARLNLTPEQSAELAPQVEPDEKTGYYRSRDIMASIERAQQHTRETGEPAFYVEADYANMGGGNKAKGSNEAFDQEFFVPATKMLREAVEAAGGDVVPGRVGGDEVGFVIVNLPEAKIRSVMISAAEKTAKMARDQGMGDIKNPKYPDSKERGINLYFGITPIMEGKSPSQIRGEADRQVNLNKIERNENGDGQTTGTAGIVAPEGQAGGTQGRTAEAVGRVPEAETAGNRQSRDEGLERVQAQLKRAPFRARLKQLTDTLEAGGGVVLTGGDFSPINDNVSRDKETAVRRTPSVNPQWFQRMAANPETAMSVGDVQKAVQKALAGEKLGVRQLRVVETILGEITESRTEPDRINAAKEELARARAQRQIATAGGNPDAIANIPAWFYDDAGQMYQEAEYSPDMDGEARGLFELANMAEQAGHGEQVEEILQKNLPDNEVAKQLFKLIEVQYVEQQQNRTAEDKGKSSQETQAETESQVNAQPIQDVAGTDRGGKGGVGRVPSGNRAQESAQPLPEPVRRDSAPARREDSPPSAADDLIADLESGKESTQAPSPGASSFKAQKKPKGPPRKFTAKSASDKGYISNVSQIDEFNSLIKKAHAQGREFDGESIDQLREIVQPDKAPKTKQEARDAAEKWILKRQKELLGTPFASTDDAALKVVSEEIRKGKAPEWMDEQAVAEIFSKTKDRETGETLGPENADWPRTGTLLDFLEGQEQTRITETTKETPDEKQTQKQAPAETKAVLSEPKPDQRTAVTDKPLAAKGLTSYRYKGRYGYVMIGAKNVDDALNEANRSLTSEKSVIDKLEVWDGKKYVQANSAPGEVATTQDSGARGKIEDFGEKLEGARKDYAKKLKDAMGLDIASHSLSEVWPEPDYQALLDNGADPFVVSFVHSSRDEIPPKPRKSWKLSRWVDQVETLRGFANDLLGGDISKSDLKEKLGGKLGLGLKPVTDRAELYQAVGHEKPLKGISISSGHYSVFAGIEYKPAKVIWSVERQAKATAFSNMPQMIAMGDTREQAIENFKKKYNDLQDKPADKQVRFEIYSYRSGEKKGKWFIGKRIGKDTLDMESFDNPKDAREYLAKNHDKLVEKLNKFKNVPSERKTTNSPRVGIDHRNGADVTPEQFSETFGFRGVQFGNYVEGSRRQEDLNEAYDALMDMAGILNIPPKAISLNGELGLAFGARGTGGKEAFAAHYERGMVVINLTKKRGAGSLAHEWWHALDNYFSRGRGEKGSFVTEFPRAKFPGDTSIRPEMIEAFSGITQAVNSGSLSQRARRLDSRKTKAYWSTGREMTARSFESYIIEKMRDQGMSNDYLANIVSPEYWEAATQLGLELEKTYPYPEAAELPAIRAAYDHFFNTVLTKETDKGIALYSKQSILPAGKRALGMRKEAVQKIADDFRADLNLPDDLNIRVVEDQSEAVSIEDTVKAYYDPSRNEIVLVAKNLNGRTDALRALQHETLAHYGFTLFDAKTRDSIIAEINKTRDAVSFKKHWNHVLENYPELSREKQAEELFARVAEDPLTRTSRLWNEIVRLVEAALRKLGFINDTMTKADMRSLVSAIADGIRRGNDQQTADAALMYQKVFHGTPHRFDRFDLEAIGTGEGVQAYGWGLYFASEKAVADFYRDNETLKRTSTPDGTLKELMDGDRNSAEFRAASALLKANLNVDTAIQEVQVSQSLAERAPDQQKKATEMLKSWRGKLLESKGHVYKVEIPDDSDLLDWDKKLKDQPEAVKKKLDAFDFGGDSVIATWKENGAWEMVSGETLYRRLSDGLTLGSAKEGKHKKASMMLNSAGIPGLRYLDATSRTDGDGTYNYVIWDENAVTVEAVNDEIRQATEAQPAFSKRKEGSDQTQTKAFRDWFGDSKVVDEKGDPLVVYHGAPDARFVKADGIFKSLNERYGMPSNGKDRAFWFAKSRQVAATYADDRRAFDYQNADPGVVSAYLKLENPLIVDGGGKTWREAQKRGKTSDVIEQAMEGGYDGVIIRNVRDNYNDWEGGARSTPTDTYVVFDSRQIKSPDNRGTFSPTDPNILYSKTKGEVPVAFQDWKMPDAMGGHFSSHMTKKGKLLTSLRQVRRKMQDKHIVWRDVQEQIQKTGGTFSDFSDAYNKFTLVEGKIGNRFKTLFDDHIQPLVADLSISGVTIEQLGEYLYAQFAPQRNARIAEINPDMPDGGSGLTNAEAKSILAGFTAPQTKQLERLAQKVYAMQRHKLDVLVDAGRITAEYRDELLKDDRYVPLKGFADQTDLVTNTEATGRGFDQARDIFKQAKGRKTLAADLLSTAVRDVENAIISAEKNRVGQAVLKLVMDNPNENLWKVNPIKIQKAFNKASGQVEQRVISDYKALARDPNVFVTWVKGKPYAIEFRDNPMGESSLARAVKNMGVDHIPVWATYLAKLNRWLSYANTALSPEFLLTNPIRDIQTALAKTFGEYDAKIAGNVLKNLPKAIRGSIGGIGESGAAKKVAEWNPEWTAYYKEYAAEGGKTDYFRTKTVDEMRRELEAELKAAAGGKKGAAIRTFRALHRTIENGNAILENMTRVSLYITLREAGYSKHKAATAAKNATVNFNRKGESGAFVNSLYLFYNASMQGAHLTLRLMKNPKVQKLMVAAGAGMITLTQYNILMGGDDDDGEPNYFKIPDYEKERNIIIMWPGGSGQYSKFPMPYGLNVPMNAAAMIAHVANGADPMEQALWLAGSAWNSFSPVGENGWNIVAPTVLDPFVDIGLNRNFMDRAIMPDDNPFEDLPTPDSQKAFASTNPAYKKTAELINSLTGGDRHKAGFIDISPESIEHLVETYTGAAGGFINRTITYATNPDLFVDEPARAPFIRKFYGEKSPFSVGQSYRDNKANILYAKERIEYLRSEARGNPEGVVAVNQFGKENAAELRLAAGLDMTEKRLTRLYKLRKQAREAGNDDVAKKHDEEIRKAQAMFNKRYNDAFLDRGIVGELGIFRLSGP